MKRKISLLLSAIVAAGSIGLVSMGTEKAEAYDSVKVVVNNTELTGDNAGVIVDGRTLVPVRAVSETVGADVDWDGGTRTATVKMNGKTISIPIDSYTIYSGGSEVSVDVPAQIINDRTMLPLRAVGEQLGLDVDWSQEDKIAYLYDSDKAVLSPYSFCNYKLKVDSDEIDHIWKVDSDMYDGEHYIYKLTNGVYGEEDWIEDYINALTENFDFKLVDSWEENYVSVKGGIYHQYVFEYTGKENLTHFLLSVSDLDKKHKYEKSPCDLYIWSKADPFSGDYWVRVEHSLDLHLVETADRTTQKLTSTGGSSGSSGSSSGGSSGGESRRECTSLFCDRGKCTNCDGSGFIYRRGSGGTRIKSNCPYCTYGKCKICGGDGYL